MLSRRERALAILSGIDPTNTFLRRVASRIVLVTTVWLGGCFGTLIVVTVGILLMGGPRLLSDVWNQTESEPRLFAQLMFAIIVGGICGGFGGGKVGSYLILKVKLLSQDALDKL